MSMTKGTPASSQIVWLEGRVQELEAENERLRVENIQMQAALGYGILAEDERHILPKNPFKCGTCDANKRLLAENEKLRAENETLLAANRDVMLHWDVLKADYERLRAALWDIHAVCNNWDWFIWMWPIRRIKRLARAALEEKS